MSTNARPGTHVLPEGIQCQIEPRGDRVEDLGDAVLQFSDGAVNMCGVLEDKIEERMLSPTSVLQCGG